jgi:hypothetical protein
LGFTTRRGGRKKRNWTVGEIREEPKTKSFHIPMSPLIENIIYSIETVGFKEGGHEIGQEG